MEIPVISLLCLKLLSRENITNKIWKQYVNRQLSKFNRLNVKRFIEKNRFMK